MPVSDVVPSSPIRERSRSSILLPNGGRRSSRTNVLIAVVLVVTVITVSTLAQSGVSKSFSIAQHHYLRDVTPVEEADVIFNGGGSTPPDHSSTSTRTLELALGKEFNELQAEKWPRVAAVNIAQLATTTRVEYLLLQTLAGAPSTERVAILEKQSVLLNDIENTNINILKELKLPTPTNAKAPDSTKLLS